MKRPIVVKFGSSLVAGPGGRVRRSVMRARSREIAALVRVGTPVCVVSSGAIALGLPRLGLAARPRSRPKLQAASALGPARPPLGKGGMRSKILAAELAASSGIPTVIAAGTGADVLGPIVAGEPRGTRFQPGERAPSAFKLWLRHGKPVAGRLHVDAGACRAVA